MLGVLAGCEPETKPIKSGTETLKARIMTQEQLKSIATCCRNSAAMLRIADAEDYDKEKRERIRELNRKQAELLMTSARMLEDACEPVEL